MGMVSTALLAAEVIRIMRPRYLVMTGICAGIKGKIKEGDVILADPSWDWQSGKRIRDADGNSSFAISPHQLNVNSAVRGHVEAIGADKAILETIRAGWKGANPGQLSVRIGPMATGSSVLSDDVIVDGIRNQNRDVRGIDMEVYGLYAAAHCASRPQPISFALKSVCDFANHEKNDNYQKYASYTSAQTMKVLFERFGDRLLSS